MSVLERFHCIPCIGILAHWTVQRVQEKEEAKAEVAHFCQVSWLDENSRNAAAENGYKFCRDSQNLTAVQVCVYVCVLKLLILHTALRAVISWQVFPSAQLPETRKTANTIGRSAWTEDVHKGPPPHTLCSTVDCCRSSRAWGFCFVSYPDPIF